jgi:staphylococcal nuclease domain-containing protein 1
LVGKEVSFVSDYTIPTTQREYGSIYLPNGDNVAELGVKNGWLKIREGGKTTREDQEETLEKLEQLQNEAQAAKLGMWNDAEKVKRKMKEGNEKNSTVF